MKKVYVLTWCKFIDQLYGSLLFFDSIRIGFPNSEIIVIDNFSIDEASNIFEENSKKIDAKFYKLKNEILHYHHIRNLINYSKNDEEIYIIDPDVIFWENIENFETDKLIAGRLIPKFFDKYSNTETKARLHTSFLYIPNAPKLKNNISIIENKYFEADLFKPTMIKNGEKWLRWDTGAQFFESFENNCHIFNDEENKKFDHIFCGSHLNLVIDKWDVNELKNIHLLARENPSALKGIYKKQHEFFLKNSV